MLKISYQTSHGSMVFKDLIKFKGIALRYFHEVWYILTLTDIHQLQPKKTPTVLGRPHTYRRYSPTYLTQESHCS